MRARWWIAVALVVAGACGDSGSALTTPDGGSTPTPDAPPSSIALKDWVTSMTDTTSDQALPDDVDSKIGVVVDTDDPAAFDSFLTQP